MSTLDPATAALVRAAAALNEADASRLAERFRAALEAGAPAAWLDELVLVGVLFVGFPRALVAAGALRTVVPTPGPVGDAASYAEWPEWQRRGEATCRVIYGERYEALRRNVAALHPALDAWVLMDGYGRTISRPQLDLRRRELCSVAMLVAQSVPRQLHSHLQGALHAGASPSEVDEVLMAVEHDVSRGQLAEARAMWSRIRQEAGSRKLEAGRGGT